MGSNVCGKRGFNKKDNRDNKRWERCERQTEERDITEIRVKDIYMCIYLKTKNSEREWWMHFGHSAVV